MDFDLNRFIEAQDRVIDRVRQELRQGRKTSHWMWFVFPQIRGLGHSPTAQFYAIRSRLEADTYLKHPVLGGRLRECTALVNAVAGRSARDIFASPDDLKFHSSMTLFAALQESSPVFADALARFFAGTRDPRTLALLAREP